MALEYTGAIMVPIERGQILLAECAAFQSFAGVASAAEAMNAIYYHELPKGEAGQQGFNPQALRSLRPCAIFRHLSRDDRAAAFLGDRTRQFDASGEMVCRLEWMAPNEIENDNAQIALQFSLLAGAIFDELEERGNQLRASDDEPMLELSRIQAGRVEIGDLIYQNAQAGVLAYINLRMGWAGPT